MMPTCNKCNNQFPNWVVIENKPRNFHGRRYCLTCLPFGVKIRDLTPPPTTKYCKGCKQERSITEFYIRRRKNTQSHCKYCSNREAIERQRKLKHLAVEYKGGRCEICGYDRCPAAMDFHHKDGVKKDFGIAQLGSRTWSKNIERELDKCALICANCHRELHWNEFQSHAVH